MVVRNVCMTLRKFQNTDAETIIRWIRSEREFREWCADRYDHYPIDAADIVSNYGNCGRRGGFFPLTAVDDNNVPVGHLILRYTDTEKTTVRFGFVIIDSSRRGEGLGKEMLGLAREYAVNKLGAETLTLGVFESNLPALNCYAAAGFRKAGETDVFEAFGEKWRVIEMFFRVR